MPDPDSLPKVEPTIVEIEEKEIPTLDELWGGKT
jgi:hypothetical protein